MRRSHVAIWEGALVEREHDPKGPRQERTGCLETETCQGDWIICHQFLKGVGDEV